MSNTVLSSLGLIRCNTASCPPSTSQPKRAKCNEDNIRLQNDIIDMSKEIQRMIAYKKTLQDLYRRTKKLIYRCTFNRFSKIIDGRKQNLKSLQDQLIVRKTTNGSSGRSEVAVYDELRVSPISWFADVEVDFRISRERWLIFDKKALKNADEVK